MTAFAPVSSPLATLSAATATRRSPAHSPARKPATRSLPASRSVSVNTVLVGLVEALRDAHDLAEPEQDIAQLVLFGRDVEAMAWRLGASEASVRWRVHQLFEKLGVSSRKGLMHVAMRAAAQRETSLELAATTPAARRSAPTTPTRRPSSRQRRALKPVVGRC